MKHFLNHDLLAPNVFTIKVDPDIVGQFADLAQPAAIESGFCIKQPSWKSDLRWISADTEEGFAVFQSAFDRLRVADHIREYLDLDKDARLYAGFLHIRSKCTEPVFHVDWTLTNNEAFTLLTPVSGLGQGQSLLFKTLPGDVREYGYKMGEAIVFGDHFVHSTPPGTCDPPFTLLVFNFGTDKMEHWDKIRRTTATQCALIRRPDGLFSRAENPANEQSDSE